MDPNSLYPIAVLIDELKCDELKRRLNAVKNLSTIAAALGHERTRNELLPYINDLVDDEDEVLIALAESLSKFLDSVGGSKFAVHILQPLENLCTAEESSVRNKATEGIKKILSQCNIKDMEQDILSLIKRLQSGEWFTSKLAATQLIPTVFTSVSQQIQQELIVIFTKMSNDEIPQVRKTTAIVLNEMAKLMPKVPEQELLGIFSKFQKDDQDSVRMQGIDSCIVFAQYLPPQKINAYLLPYIKKYAEDKSWRIRYLVADKILQLSQGIGVELAKEHLIPYFCNFLNDSESEVRTAAVARIADVAQIIDPQVIVAKVIPCLKKLSTDTFQYVRSALSQNVLAICPSIGKAATNDHIIPIFLTLLRDESPEVRLGLFKRLEDLNKIIGIENLSQSIVPALQDLSTDKNWKVKLDVVSAFPLLAKQLGEQFFNDRLTSICVLWINDPVFIIRDSSLKNFKELVGVFGASWITKAVLPKILSMNADKNYLQRMTPLFAIQVIGPVLTHEIHTKYLMPVLTGLAQDSVPNIRINVAKAIKENSTLYKSNKDLEDKAKALIKTLSADKDIDVSYYARKAGI